MNAWNLKISIFGWFLSCESLKFCIYFRFWPFLRPRNQPKMGIFKFHMKYLPKNLPLLAIFPGDRFERSNLGPFLGNFSSINADFSPLFSPIFLPVLQYLGDYTVIHNFWVSEVWWNVNIEWFLFINILIALFATYDNANVVTILLNITGRRSTCYWIIGYRRSTCSSIIGCRRSTCSSISCDFMISHVVLDLAICLIQSTTSYTSIFISCS